MAQSPIWSHCSSLYLKTSSAEFAGERLEAGVLPAVGDQVRRLAERLAAHDALVRFLPYKQRDRTLYTDYNDFCNTLTIFCK